MSENIPYEIEEPLEELRLRREQKREMEEWGDGEKRIN